MEGNPFLFFLSIFLLVKRKKIVPYFTVPKIIKEVYHEKYFFLMTFCLFLVVSISLGQFDPWTTKANMLMARSGHSTCVVNGKIYVIGGVKDGNSATISTVEEYDLATDTWTTKTGMQTPRSWFGICAVNGKIYAIGGGKSVLGVGLSTVDEYDPVADTWTTKSDMPTARYVLSASVVNGKIYAIGGKPRHGAAPLATVEEYDPEADTWTTKTSMNKERFGLFTCVMWEDLCHWGNCCFRRSIPGTRNC